MNKKQKIAFLVGIGIMVLMGLFPPWGWYNPKLGFYSGQYAFLFSNSYDGRGHIIDVTRLFIQWAVVAIATAGIMWFLKDDNGRSQKGG